RRRARFKPWAEMLEDRLVLATVFWNTDLSGFWDVGSNWSTGAVPTASDDVVIDRGTANPTVTVRSGDQAVQSLTSQDELVVSGGSLSLAANSTIYNAFTLSGATLTGTGDVTVAGPMTWQAGLLEGSGIVTVNG